MLGAILPVCRGVTGVHRDEFSIYANGNGFRHGPPQRFAGTADTAEWELRGAGREFARRLVLPWRAMWGCRGLRGRPRLKRMDRAVTGRSMGVCREWRDGNRSRHG